MKNMLVVEDDLLSQQVLKRIFQSEYNIDICSSFDMFFEKYIDNNYDIILMDISLSGKKTGLDLTQELKAHPKHSNTPILCLTAHALKRDEKNAMQAGVDLFVVKPVENSVLKVKVKELIESFA